MVQRNIFIKMGGTTYCGTQKSAENSSCRGEKREIQAAISSDERDVTFLVFVMLKSSIDIQTAF